MSEWAYLELESVPDLTCEYYVELLKNKEWIDSELTILGAVIELFNDQDLMFRYREKNTYDRAKLDAKMRIADGQTGSDIDKAYDLMFNAGYIYAKGEMK